MTTRAKTIMLAFTMVSMLAAPFAEAARLGKGKSAGMQRSAPTRSYQQQAPARPVAPPAQAPAPAQAQPKSGPGIGTAVAAGAAGAAAGYMLGSAMSDKGGQQQAPAAANGNADPALAAQAQGQQPQKSGGMPWGTLALLGLVLVGGYMFFRRKAGAARPAMAAPQAAGMPQNMGGYQEPARFDSIPKIGSGLGGAQPAFGAAAAYDAPARLPDGTETPNFLRQAKATFLHLQSLNSTESLEEVRKYMTPDLFNALREDIAGNTDVADFPQLDCQLSEASTEGNRYIASVRFSGMVSEAVNAPTEPFTEYWHYIKDDSTNGKWLVAGIQQ
ncbi:MULTISPECIES: Tim44 domain-containing protein [Chromobacterium]|uniref:Tim44 domain-containing protein n=2 Tax=Chromobacterium TaxID=535 RepID=A0ABS3GI40_9NEIS|nr:MULTISPECIES: Tim44-like domain-containing protein [Chromobacterium]AXT48470.1 Tim44 domain-containing protein [Chromobacterium rhizoryzae]MBK0412846.1 Tim44 domain-containing protein [Chromobacterium haemolyticum]MBO0413948.1 Tim44 domain-containing protein [Chromobacterium haemolyticum]MBO0497208.1 Tim44 domain-containing protein [Chromobacterium haemolyticum]